MRTALLAFLWLLVAPSVAEERLIHRSLSPSATIATLRDCPAVPGYWLYMVVNQRGDLTDPMYLRACVYLRRLEDRSRPRSSESPAT